MNLAAQKTDTFGEAMITGIHWHHLDGSATARGGAHIDRSEIAPSLCVAFENGLIQLSRGDDDANAIVVNTELKITFCAWDAKGTTLAVTGTLMPPPSQKGRDRDRDRGDGEKEKEKAVRQSPHHLIGQYSP